MPERPTCPCTAGSCLWPEAVRATLLLVALLLPGCRATTSAEPVPDAGLVSRLSLPYYADSIAADHVNFYSPESLAWMAVGFGGGAAIANTSADEAIQDWYQDDVRGRTGDDFAHAAKQFGEGKYIFPAFGAAFLLGCATQEHAAGSLVQEWGERGLRATLVGGPAMLFGQVATGASRPGEDPDKGSRWRPFDDDNGVSGHAFVGALPFLTAARMTDDPWCKAGLYLCSTWTAWSRVHDDAHFTSQAALGWMMAWMACHAVDRSYSNSKDSAFEFVPVHFDRGQGIGLLYRF